MVHVPPLPAAAVGDPGPIPEDPAALVHLHAAAQVLTRLAALLLSDKRGPDYYAARIAALYLVDVELAQRKLAAAIQEFAAVQP
jgi:hypothetical protein